MLHKKRLDHAGEVPAEMERRNDGRGLSDVIPRRDPDLTATGSTYAARLEEHRGARRSMAGPGSTQAARATPPMLNVSDVFQPSE